MKKVTFLALFYLTLFTNSFAQTNTPSAADTCANNFLTMFSAVSKDTSGKFKKIIFTYDADKDMLKLAEELARTPDPVKGPEALAIFKKAKPIITKHAKKEFNLCVDFTKAMNKELARICPGIQYFSKECHEGATSSPKVFKLLKESDKAVKELIFARNKYGNIP